MPKATASQHNVHTYQKAVNGAPTWNIDKPGLKQDKGQASLHIEIRGPRSSSAQDEELFKGHCEDGTMLGNWYMVYIATSS